PSFFSHVASPQHMELNIVPTSNCVASKQPVVGYYFILVGLFVLGLMNVVVYIVSPSYGFGQFVPIHLTILIMSAVVVFSDARTINRAKGRSVVGGGGLDDSCCIFL